MRISNSALVIRGNNSLLLGASRETPRQAGQFIDKLLAEYADERSKEACDRCEQCGPMVMCSFHSILSLLEGETALSDGTFRRRETPQEPTK
jgi:hypothetical protein